MTFTAIETIALILIVVSAIKLLALLVNPKGWMNFAKDVWKNEVMMQVISLVLGIIVLYYLVQSGIGIVEILAVTVFIMLLMVVGMAPEVSNLIKMYDSKVKKGRGIFKEYWLYVLIWIALLIWGAKEIFG
jgi:hypothetical protein|tara:strand:- start:6169 stop:6561 length:393 start_codon:yes stop_codon:yes gene_type:complete